MYKIKDNGDNDKGEVAKSESITSVTLDEALLQTGFGVFNILHMLLSGVILLGVIMQNLMLGYALPAAQCDLDLTTRQQGLLAAIPFIATILTSYFWGWLGDTRGRRPVMLYSMLTSIVFSVITSFAPDVISFAVLQFLSSIFASGSTAVVYTYLGEFNNLRHRDKMVAFGSSFVGIGTVVLPAVAWLILPLSLHYPITFLHIAYRPWRLLIVACALPYSLASLCLFYSPESPKFLNAYGQQDACLCVLKKIYAVNKRKHEDSYPVKSLTSDQTICKNVDSEKRGGIVAILASMKEQTAPLFKMPLLPWICLTSFVQFGIFAATNGFYIWFPTILNSLAHDDSGNSRICDVLEAGRAQILASNSTTVVECDDTFNASTFERSIYIGLVFSSMYIIVGFLVDLVGKKWILVVSLVATGLCAVGAHLVYNQQAAVAMFAVFQMSGACIGVMNAVSVEMIPTQYRAMAICLAMMMGRTGSMVGSNVLALLLTTNCAVSFYLFGGIIVVNGLVCLMLPGRKSIREKNSGGETQRQSNQPV